MNHLDVLRAPVLSSDMPWLSCVVERIFFDPAHGNSTVEVFAGRPAALERFVQFCGGELTEEAAIRVIAEGGFYRPTYKVKLETLEQYRLLYGPEDRPTILVDNRSTKLTSNPDPLLGED